MKRINDRSLLSHTHKHINLHIEQCDVLLYNGKLPSVITTILLRIPMAKDSECFCLSIELYGKENKYFLFKKILANSKYIIFGALY